MNDKQKEEHFRLINEAITGNIKKRKEKKSEYLGWISLIVSFMFFPVGAVIGIILASLSLTQKNHNHTIPKVSLFFAGSLLLFFFLSLFLAY